MEPANETTTDNTAASTAVQSDVDSEVAVAPVEGIKRTPGPDDLDSPVTSTHDVHGGGNPRLVMEFHDSIDLDIKIAAGETRANVDSGIIPKEFPLLPGTTSIGSAEDNDICLPGLKPHHAVVERDQIDEYNLIDLSDGETIVDGGRLAAKIPLRTGRRVELRDWTLVYQRAEYADHGLPYGGHTGGEFVGHPAAQDVPRPRGTSPSGGAEPTATDPGEYF